MIAGVLAALRPRRLGAGRDLYRIHDARHGPWWFASGARGRFNLAPSRGTCALAESPA